MDKPYVYTEEELRGLAGEQFLLGFCYGVLSVIAIGLIIVYTMLRLELSFC